MDHSKVFLQDIPDIGKSELAKAYAKRCGKKYTNVIYVNYPGDLKQAVIHLDFADDRPDETDGTRFKRYNRFLRSLQGDTLLIVDNFNVTAFQDQFLDVMLKYRCRIVFTTRSRYEKHISLEQLTRTLLQEHECVEFLVGRDGEFDQIVSSTIRSCKREYRGDNSAHVWVLSYLTAELRDNEESFRDYDDEIEVCEAAAGSHYRNAHQTRYRAMVDRLGLVVFCIR